MTLLTGQTRIISARVSEPGVIYRVPPSEFRRLMAQDAEISDVLLRGFLARRKLITVGAADHLEVIADSASRDGLALATFLERQALPHRWVESDTAEGRRALAAAGLAETDVPPRPGRARPSPAWRRGRPASTGPGRRGRRGSASAAPGW
jgi:thioredoxin reductase (NADPH)